MKELRIPLKEEIHIYIAWLNTINWLRKNKLAPKEMEIVAYFIYYYNQYSSLDNAIRKELLFSSSTKTKIKEALKLKSGVFDNYMKSLRSKGIIKEGSIIPSLIISPVDGKFTLNITYATT